MNTPIFPNQFLFVFLLLAGFSLQANNIKNAPAECNPGIIIGQTTICAGLTTQLSSTGDAGGIWNSDNPAVATVSSTGLVNGVPGIGGTATISYTVAGACGQTATALVTVNPLPNATIAVTESGQFGLAGSLNNDAIICHYSFPLSYSAVATLAASGGGTYLWSTGATTNTITFTQPQPSTSPTYSYTVTVTNVNGCQATATRTIFDNPIPNAGTISATPHVPNFNGLGLCENSTITLSSSVPGGSWLAGNKFPSPQIVSIDAVTGVVNPLVSTLGTVDTHSVYYVMTVDGCRGSTRTTVEVLSAPNAGTISGAASVCAGNTTPYSSNGTTAFNTIRTWSSSDNSVATVNPSSGLVTGVSGGTATITYTVTTVSGSTPICTSTAQKTITVSQPACNIEGAIYACENSMVTYTAPPGMSVYSWAKAGAGTIVGATNGQSINIQTGGTGSFTLMLTLTDANGCTSSCSKFVYIAIPLPSSSITVSPSSTVCLGITLDLSVQSASSSTVSWSGEGIATPSGNPGTSATPISAGIKTYSVTVTNDFGCASTSTALVTVGQPITCSISGPTSACPGGTSTFNAPAGLGIYNWSITGSGTISGPSNSASVNILAGASGTYTVSVTLTNNGCTSSCNQEVTISPPMALLTGGGNYCGGTSVTLSASGGVSYSWSRRYSIDPSIGPSISLGTGDNKAVTQSGVYFVTVTNGAGCTAVTSTIVNIADYVFSGSVDGSDPVQIGRMNRDGNVSTCTAPNTCALLASTGNRNFDQYSIPNPTNNPICVNVGINSGCGSTAYVITYLNSFDPNNICTNYLGREGTSADIMYQDVTVPANQTLIVVVHGLEPGQTCSNYSLYVDMPFSFPGLAVTAPGTTCQGTATSLSAPAYYGASYSWAGNGIVPSSSNTTTATLSTAGPQTYTVTVTSANGCTSATASATVSVNVVPNCPTSFGPPFNGQNGVAIFSDTLRWSAVPNITHYLVYFGTNAPNYDNIFNGVNNSTSNRRSYSTLSPNTTYGYRIVPVNACGPAIGCPTNTFSTCIPTFTCPANRDVNLNTNCAITIPDLVSGLAANPGCGSLTFTQIPPAGTVVPTSHNATVPVTIMPNNTSVSSCQVNLTAIDITAPTVVCKNATVNLNAAGTGSITTASVFQSGADNCGTVNQVSVTPNSFTCANLGANTVTLLVNDGHGNTAICTAIVTVIDNIAPTVVCKNATVNLSAAGTGSITTGDVFQSGADNCGTVNQVSVTPNSFTCANLGANTVTLLVNDGHGNTATCTATVTVADNLAPTVVCKNATINLNAAGTVIVTIADVFQSVTDNCGIVNPISVIPSLLTCDDLGTNIITLVVDDGHSNTAFCFATVTVVDNIVPTVVCKNATINLSAAGTGSITTGDVFQSGADNCGTVNQVSVTPNSFTCANLGANTVTLLVNDGHGNTATCTAIVTVIDNIAPTVVCKNATINLSAAGTGSITTGDVFQSGADNCGTVNQVSVTPNSFTCANLGANTVTLLVNDGHGNTATCTAIVTVIDNIAPTVVCKNATINLSAAGTGSITTGDVFQSGADNCGTVNQVSVTPSSFTCANLGANTVTLLVNDGHGNTAICTAIVTVIDNIAPTVVCKNATINLSAAGTGSITTGDVFQSGADNCGTVNQVSVTPNSFTCANLGANTVTLLVNDGHGNTAICTSIVTVIDNIAPTVVCKNATVNLSAAGTGSITTGDVFQSGADNCGTVNQVSVTPNSFTCANLGANTVTLLVNDGHGNTAICTATVTVIDNIAPTVVCQNATVSLNAAGTGSITTGDVFQSGADNCGIVNQVSVTPSSFTCANLGANTVTLLVNDGHGNTAICTSIVTVIDNIAPTVVCKNATVNLSAAGTGSITTGDVFQSGADNCGTVNQVSVTPSSFTCANLGANTVTLLVNDGHGNTATCTATVTVIDNIAPTVVCQNATVNLSAAGTGSITTGDVFQSGADNCGTVNQVSVTPNSFTCANLGANTVTLLVNDGHGNTATCTATVTVIDNIAPTVVCQNATVNLNAAGTGSITTGDVFQSGADNCGMVNQVSVTPNSFTCTNLGANTVTLLVNDGHGNTATCTATVTVEDNILPTIVCPGNITQVTTNGECYAAVDFTPLAQDNCGIVNTEYNHLPNSEFELGATSVQVNIADASGNTAQCQFWVFVVSGQEICDGLDNDCDGSIDEPDGFAYFVKELGINPVALNQFGNAVALDSSRAIVGIQLDDQQGIDAGAAQIYERNSAGQWIATKHLIANDATAGDQFGHAVAIRNNWALVAAHLRNQNGVKTGAVYVFERNTGGSNNWGLVTTLTPSGQGANVNFGYSLSFDGRFALVGSNFDSQQGTNAGAAYIFDAQNTWSQVANLIALNGMPNDEFGHSVAIDNQEFALIGAPGNDSIGLNAGAAYLFRRNAVTGAWAQVKKLSANNTAAGDQFGFSVALDGPTAVVGAPRNDLRTLDGGVAYVFERNRGGLNNWGEGSKLFAYDSEAKDRLGSTVAVEGDLAVVGTPYENAKGFASGSANTYLRQGDGQWIIVQKLMDPSGNSSDNLFASLALSNRTILAGAPNDDEQGLMNNGSVLWFDAQCAEVGNMLVIPDNGITQFGSEFQEVSLRSPLLVYPVPFMSDVYLNFNLTTPSESASVVVTNAMDQVITTLHKGALSAGVHEMEWRTGESTPAGIYFLRIDAGAMQEVRRLIKVKE